MPARQSATHAHRLDDTHAIAKTLNLSIVAVKRHHARALHLLVRGLAATEWADLVRRVVDGTPYAVPQHTDDDA